MLDGLKEKKNLYLIDSLKSLISWDFLRLGKNFSWFGAEWGDNTFRVIGN